MKTLNGVIDYEVKVFGYLKPDPALVLPSDLGSLNPVDILSTVTGGGTNGGPPIKYQTGITTISINRTKDAPDAAAYFTFQGKLPKNVIIGSWVLMYSIIKDQKIPKFCGQICTIAPAYITNPNGLVTTTHDVTVREWSSSLRSEMRFNATSFYEAQNGGAAAFVQQAATALAASGAKLTPAELNKLLATALNPYRFAQVLLAIVGAINKTDLSKEVEEMKITKFDQIVTGLPNMPSELIAELGFPTSGKPDTGFRGITVISGIQTAAFKNDGSWNGLLSASEFVNYKKSFKTDFPHVPVSSQMFSVLQGTWTTWSVLARCCEPSINEMFTDMLYVKNGSKIIAKPVIVIRAMPFLTKETKGLVKDLFNQSVESFYPYYEDLPRTTIDEAYIMGFKITQSLLGSPNYIQTGIASSLVNKDSSGSIALASGFLKSQTFQQRWGGMPAYPEATYASIGAGSNPTGFDLVKYNQELAALNAAWYSFNYRQPSGTLMLKSPSVPLSIGTNLQFKFRKRTLIGHIEGISEKVVVHPDGLVTTDFTIRLSRIMKVVNGKVKLLSIDEPARLQEV